MKVKADKRGKHTNKMEKKNKKIDKEEFDTIFAHDQEDLKKKESYQKKYAQTASTKPQSSNSNKELNTPKKSTSINMFTEGLSYEKIDHNKYNKALSNFNNLFTKDLNKNNHKKIEQKEKKGQISKKYLCERALYKGIEIEIKLNKDKNNKSIDEIMKLLNNFFINENNFIYYEYSNSRNISFNKLSEGDMLSYRYFYKNYDNIYIDNNIYNNKEEYIKQLDYVNTLNNLFFKYNINKKIFYIITPLYAFSFNYNKDIPLLLTSSKSLDFQLKKNEIKVIRFDSKKVKQNKNISNKNINKSNESKLTNENNDKSDINDDEYEEEIESNIGALKGVSKLYVGLLYNFFVNQNVLKPFNIFSNFDFEGCLFRKCKAQIIKLKKNGENNNYYIIIKVEGIIFEETILHINDFFKNKLELNNYNIRLNKIKSTGIFYKENKDIESSFERFEYKDNNYYFYKQ